MSTVKLLSGSREQFSTVWKAEIYGQSTDSTFELLDSETLAVRQIFYGRDFNYSGFINNGYISKIDYFGYTGKLILSWSDVNILVSTYNDNISIGRGAEDLAQIILKGNDNIYGSSEADLLLGSAGSDYIDGGAGRDLISFQSYDGHIKINLAKSLASTASGTSRIVNVEDVSGGKYNDVLIGNKYANELQGREGDDTLDGGRGVDTAIYREASASIVVDLSKGTASGGADKDALISIENVIGSRFDDVLIGNGGSNVFDGGLGNDNLDGLKGFDMVTYDVAPRAVSIDLEKGLVTGGFGKDNLVSIEGAIGTDFGDTIIGSKLDNSLLGGAGNDLLHGRLGNDVLTGGTGRDTFFFSTQLGASNVDHITDFAGIDTIRLSKSIFTALAPGELKANEFKDIAKAKVDADDHILYDSRNGSLFYDADGSGKAAAVKFAVLDNKAAITHADFLVA